MASLLGRAHELRAVDAVLDESRRSGRILLVEGEAGIGKTRLAEEALARAGGFTVLRGGCEELEQGRAFGPLARALAPHLDEGLSGDDAYGGVETVLATLETLAARAPVLLVVEDLHWSDHATLRTMLAIGRSLVHLRLALLATMRPVPRNAELEGVLERLPRDSTRRLALGPLGEDAAVALATEVAGAPPGAGLAAALRGTGGNPLFLVELLEALRDDGGLEIVDGRCELRTTRLPPTLNRTVLRRLRVLPDETMEVLRVASVLGSSFLPAHLGVVMRRHVVDLLSALRDAIAAGVITEHDDRLRFRHDLIRDAVYTDLPHALRVALHAEAGKALDEAGAPAETVAEHVVLGANAGDADTIGWMRRAAADLTNRAPQTVVRLLERALELTTQDDPARDAIAASLVFPLEVVGRRADARRLGDEVLGRDPALDVEYVVELGIAYSCLAGGDPATAVEHYRLVTAERFAPVRTAAEHAIELGNYAVSLFLSGDLAAANDEVARALAAARTADDDSATIFAEMPMGLLARARGDLQDALAITERAVRLAEAEPSAQVGNAWPHLMHGLSLIDADRLAEAERTLDAGLRNAEKQGRGAQVLMYHTALARRHVLAGAWEHAEAEVEAAAAAAEESVLGRGDGDPPMLGAGLFAFASLRRGDLARAEDALRSIEMGDPLGLDYALAAKALVAEAQGDGRGVFIAVSEAWDLIRAWGYFWEWRSIGPQVVRLALACDDRPRAAAVTEACEEGARRAGASVATAEGAALRCRGMLDADAGVLLRAVDAYRRGPRPYELALGCEDAAARLAADGRVAEAEPLFDESLGIHRDLGCTHDAARVASAMRAAGIRRGTRGLRTRPAFGWESLTPTELEAVGLVAGGLTNRQIADRLFKSRYTVESHLRHVFAKLGVSSRVELAGEAVRRGIARD
jgi:DNA-binding CsgD family transcriptional regulator